MSKGGKLLHILRREMDKRPNISQLEFGTVLSADPLVISIDSGDGLTLEFDRGDFVMPDYLILSQDDHVVMEPIGNGHQYAIHYRLRGKLDEAVIGGKNAKVVARVGDPIDFTFTINNQTVGDHGSHNHGVTITVQPVIALNPTAPSKVKVD